MIFCRQQVRIEKEQQRRSQRRRKQIQPMIPRRRRVGIETQQHAATAVCT